MEFNKQISFKPTAEMAKALENLFVSSGLPEDSSKTDFINQVVFKAIDANYCTPNDYQLLKVEIQELENVNGELRQTIHSLENERNEISKTATGLQLVIQEFENRGPENNATPLFTPETTFKLWCILQLFKQQKPGTTFENMIVSIINSFQNNGYLKLNTDDLKYIETIKANYNGIIE